MPDSTDIHLLVKDYDSFAAFLEELDTEQNLHEFDSAIEGIGREITESIGTRFLSQREAGYARVLWEAHHQDESKPEIEGIA